MVGKFILRFLFCFPISLALWCLVADALFFPLLVISNAVLQLFGDNLVISAHLSRGIVYYDTGIVVRMPDGRTGDASIAISLMKYTYTFPALLSLILSGRYRFCVRRVFVFAGIGYLFLLPAWSWGQCFDYFRTVAVALGPQVVAQIGITNRTIEFVALGYQFGYLMLPSISLLLVWGFLCSEDLEVLMDGGRAMGESQSADRAFQLKKHRTKDG